jgi:protein required for attachment to host cells
MVQHRNPCFVIADGGRARFVKPAADNGLHTQEALESDAAHLRSHDLGSDRPGRAFESGNPARHSHTPRVDPHDKEKARFAHLVGERIRAESARGAFSELILVAPPPVLAELVDALDKPTGAKLVGTLAKDLVKVPDDELWPHLKEWARPVHRL